MFKRKLRIGCTNQLLLVAFCNRNNQSLNFNPLVPNVVAFLALMKEAS